MKKYGSIIKSLFFVVVAGVLVFAFIIVSKDTKTEKLPEDYQQRSTDSSLLESSHKEKAALTAKLQVPETKVILESDSLTNDLSEEHSVHISNKAIETIEILRNFKENSPDGTAEKTFEQHMRTIDNYKIQLQNARDDNEASAICFKIGLEYTFIHRKTHPEEDDMRQESLKNSIDYYYLAAKKANTGERAFYLSTTCFCYIGSDYPEIKLEEETVTPDFIIKNYLLSLDLLAQEKEIEKKWLAGSIMKDLSRLYKNKNDLKSFYNLRRELNKKYRGTALGKLL